MPYGLVGPPWWDEVWIVACGPSASTFDLSRLTGKMVVTVNAAFDLLDLDLVRTLRGVVQFSVDPDYTRDRLEAGIIPAYVAIALGTHPDLANIPGVTYLQRADSLTGLSDHPGYVCTGGNSGYAAINLAYLKRATDIHLVGFDMDPSVDDKFRQWIPRFQFMLPQLRERNVRVINHNPDSFIDAFPKAV